MRGGGWGQGVLTEGKRDAVSSFASGIGERMTSGIDIGSWTADSFPLEQKGVPGSGRWLRE